MLPVGVDADFVQNSVKLHFTSHKQLIFWHSLLVQESAEQAELELEKWTFQGQSFLVCRESLVVYAEQHGREVGKWGEGRFAGAVIL